MEKKKGFLLDAAYALCGYPPRRLKEYPVFSNYELIQRSSREREKVLFSRLHLLMPSVTVIIRAFDTPLHLLHRTLLSLCASDFQSFKTTLVMRKGDRRLQSAPSIPQLSIVYGPTEPEAFKNAEKQVRSDLVMILSSGDMLSRGALREMLTKAGQIKNLDLISADHDSLIRGLGDRPCFKPAPDLLTELSSGMFRSPLMVSRILYKSVGGLFGAGGAELFAARCINGAQAPCHIPHSLLTTSSTEAPLSSPVWLDRKLLLLPANADGFKRVFWARGKRPLASVIVESGSGFEPLSQCIERLEAISVYPNTELIVSSGKTDDTRLSTYLSLLQDCGIAYVVNSEARSRIQRLYAAAKAARGRYLIFLSSELTPENPDFIEELITPLLLPKCGFSGGKILSSDGNLEHTGFIRGLTAGSGSFYSGEADDGADRVKYGLTRVQRTVSAVSLDFAAAERSVFLRCAGEYKRICCDADLYLCEEISNMGLKTAYTPFACARRIYASDVSKRKQEPPGGVSRSYKRDECVSPVYDLRFSIPRIKLSRPD